MSNKVAGHRRHLAHELVHGRNLGRFAVSLRGFRFATVTEKIGAKFFPHMLLFQYRTEGVRSAWEPSPSSVMPAAIKTGLNNL